MCNYFPEIDGDFFCGGTHRSTHKDRPAMRARSCDCGAKQRAAGTLAARCAELFCKVCLSCNCYIRYEASILGFFNL